MRKIISLSTLFIFSGLVGFMAAVPSSNIALFWVIKNDVEKKVGDQSQGKSSDWSKVKKGDLIFRGSCRASMILRARRWATCRWSKRVST